MDIVEIRARQGRWTNDEVFDVCVTLSTYRATERSRTNKHVTLLLTYERKEDTGEFGIRDKSKWDCASGEHVTIPGECDWTLSEGNSTKTLDKRYGLKGIAALVVSGLSQERVTRDIEAIRQGKKFKAQLQQRLRYTQTKIANMKQRLAAYEQLAE